MAVLASLLRLVGTLAIVAAVAWVGWVESQIHWYARHDEARPANAIAIFGAAEYDGRPSPVLRARLDHGLELYQRGLAPLMITLGGSEPSDQHSEGAVGQDYLLAHGVPESAIIAETQSSNTEESARRLSIIARANRLKSIVVVSDGTHLFRTHAICEKYGLTVYTSPRPVGHSIPLREALRRTTHEVVSYTLWRMHIH
ncbi:YdcF family protein [Paracidobacterium acidisoli]|uniref:YdcF family protein n=1 Tax=Paracidobacterium acidisoli TaxID=2303751 RepID=UPI003D9DB77B